ncbi:MAG: SIS domain-containing protein [Chloroflexota bacterium]|nr:SIS domain-containing protein [Chloroflexota bacterium]
MLANDYLINAQSLVKKIQETQMKAILEAASWITDSLAEGGILHVFGSGHSHMSALEAQGRAGGLVPVQPINDPTQGKAERLEGYAAVVLNQWDVREGEVIMIFSNSGINAVPIEMAMEAKDRGLKVIAVTSMAHTRSAAPRHSSGLKLYEVADLVIDNCGIIGDASIEVPGFPGRAGATSSIASVAIVNAITVQVAQNLAERGIMPPILISANVAGGDEHNEQVRAQYRERLKKTMGPSYRKPVSAA